MKHTPFFFAFFYLPLKGRRSSCETECEDEQ
ncbi:pheA operon leader peptide PheL [Shigella flexneri]